MVASHPPGLPTVIIKIPPATSTADRSSLDSLIIQTQRFVTLLVAGIARMTKLVIERHLETMREDGGVV